MCLVVLNLEWDDIPLFSFGPRKRCCKNLDPLGLQAQELLHFFQQILNFLTENFSGLRIFWNRSASYSPVGGRILNESYGITILDYFQHPTVWSYHNESTNLPLCEAILSPSSPYARKGWSTACKGDLKRSPDCWLLPLPERFLNWFLPLLK